jgi:isocitrate dehydrogenase
VESTLLPDQLAKRLDSALNGAAVRLLNIANRGTTVFPLTEKPVGLVDHYWCLFVARKPEGEVPDTAILDLLQRLGTDHRWMHVEKLQQFDGVDGFSKAAGQA